MAKATIAAGYPKAFLDYAVSRGADRHTMLERSDIRPEDLREQYDRIPLTRYIDLLRAGIELCREPALALQFGEAVRIVDISIVALIGESAETPEEMRRQTNRYARLDLDDGTTSDRVEMVRNQQGTWMKITGSAYQDNVLLTESALARHICGARAMFGAGKTFQGKPFPLAIHFTHAEPGYRDEYDRVFGVPLTFGSDMNAVQIDESMLPARMPRTNRYVFGVLSERADALLKELEGSKTVRGRVEGILLPILHTGDASMELISDKLGQSRQTLFRKLKSEGTTFEKVLDELRHRLALEYLKGKKVSVNQAAYLVGFSDPAAFSRAFKRWTGASPGTLRDRPEAFVPGSK